MKLCIDTTNNLTTSITLDNLVFLTHYDSPRDQDIHNAVVSALSQAGVTTDNLTEIQVATGPGSFTGIRVGVAYAQALAIGLGIPLNGLPPGSVMRVEYGQEPSITNSPKLKMSNPQSK